MSSSMLPANPEQEEATTPMSLEKEPQHEDYFSGYGSSTASITESINAFVIENGRMYHTYFGHDKNLLPTDALEQDRLDMWHEIALRLLGGRLHLSPLDHPQRVLDIGTGTGIWAIDMADKYPMAEVTGIDLNPIQPKWLPQNCKFEIGDVEGDWTFQPDHFDFVHARNLFIGISDWPRLMKEIYRATAPGGYVELTEQGLPTFNDAVMPDDNPINIYSNLMKQAMAKIGRSVVSSDSTLRLRLEQAGFVDIRVAKVKQPIGKWPKDAELKHIGGVGLLQCETGFASYGMAALTRILAMDAEEAERLCRACFSVAMMRESHLFTFTAYGRKPEGPADCDPFLYGK